MFECSVGGSVCVFAEGQNGRIIREQGEIRWKPEKQQRKCTKRRPEAGMGTKLKETLRKNG